MSGKDYVHVVVVVLIGILTGPTRAQTTWYVDDDAVGDPNEDGSAGHPFDAIQEGIDAAADGDTVLVLDGRYAGNGNKNLDFTGKPITVRSESGPDNCIIDCQGGGRGFHFHSGETGASIVNGFTITGAYIFEEDGAGIYCSGSSPTIMNCTITGNMADYASGGGLCCDGGNATVTNCAIAGNSHSGVACSGGSPRISHCTITDNRATIMVIGTGISCWRSNATITDCTIARNTGGVFGGGVCCFGGSPTITGCSITANQAYEAGGGITCADDSSLAVDNCTIAGNLAEYRIGGGIYCAWDGTASITNCMIVGNSTSYSGGGIGCEEGGSAIATNCTVVGNAVPYGSGGGVCCEGGGRATIANCILWANIPNEITGPAVVTYSDIQEGCPGTGNIDADPLFVDPNNGDYRLAAGSPCIDAGCNWAVPPDTADLDADGDTSEITPLDLDGEGRFFDDPVTPDDGCGHPPIVDMGACEFGGTGRQPCFADLDDDRDVGLGDLATLLAHYGESDTCDGDLTCDGDVDLADLSALLAAYGATCD